MGTVTEFNRKRFGYRRKITRSICWRMVEQLNSEMCKNWSKIKTVALIQLLVFIKKKMCAKNVTSNLQFSVSSKSPSIKIKS